MQYEKLRKLAEKQMQDHLFEEALLTIRQMDDEYARGIHLARLVGQMEQAGKITQAIELVDEARNVINNCGMTESLGGDLAVLAAVLAKYGHGEKAQVVFQEAFHMARHQPTDSEAHGEMKKVADKAILFYDNVFSLIDDEDLEDHEDYVSSLPGLIRYLLFKKFNSQDLEGAKRLAANAEKAIGRLKKPLTQALSKIPIAETWAAMCNVDDALNLYNQALPVIQNENDDYFRDLAMTDFIASLTRAGFLDRAMEVAESTSNPWEYFWIRYEIANILTIKGQQDLGQEHIDQIRQLCKSPKYIEKLQALSEQRYAPVDELLSSMNDMLNDYSLHCKWPDGYAGEPQKRVK